MKIHVDRFVSNNPDTTLDNIIKDLKVGVTKECVINVWFETADKYVKVEANGSLGGPDYSGEVITIAPYIESHNPLNLDLADWDFDEYLDHKDYYYISLVIEAANVYYNSTVIPLKYEYFVSFVPNSMVMDYDCLEPAELIEWIEK